MPDFPFRDRPDKQRVQLTLGKASSSADAEQFKDLMDKIKQGTQHLKSEAINHE